MYARRMTEESLHNLPAAEHLDFPYSQPTKLAPNLSLITRQSAAAHDLVQKHDNPGRAKSSSHAELG